MERVFYTIPVDSCIIPPPSRISNIRGRVSSLLQSKLTVIDTQKLAVHRKRVRPLNKQGDYESRKLWQHVTNALRLNDIETATEHKTLV